ncbi:SusC/RagA family TonB-linked outer membrane protein [Segetibacter koreensis]|uniref:SusC/RagA family TonB-linked outer membrane protein n=1 Tax=Segetibacter koreensis TaxID=398037 RepID=UPI00035E628E|nr:TonB-dependent receptor [Segetibacter koreensis]
MKKHTHLYYVCSFNLLTHIPYLTFKKILLVSLLLISFTIASAQNKVHIRGVVTDEKNIPLANCSVTIKGAASGVSTDSKGAFVIDANNSKSVLIVSYIGYITQEVPVGKGSNLNIKLTASSTALNDVVVVAYGTQKKTSVTAAVSTIKGDAIAEQPVANISNSIAGRVTGVIATQGSGEPGTDGSRILIRGISTTGNTEPLVIVDGIPRNYTQLDPNSIASISILKDAAAVAAYGMGGANGVILITTKKGKTSAPSLSYSTYSGLQNPTQLTKFVNAYQYATLFNAANDNEGTPHAYSQEDLQKFKDHSDPDGHPDHNVLKELIHPNTLIMSHNLSLSGGGERIRYYTGVGFLSQNGAWGPTNYKRYNLTANIDADVTATTKVSLSINGRVEDRHFPGRSSSPSVGDLSIFNQAFRTPPIAPLTFTNGLWGGYIGRSAYGNVYHSGYNQTTGYTLLNQISIEQQLPFIKGLSVKGVVSYDFNPFNPTDPNNPSAAITSFNRSWLTPIPYYSYDPATHTYPLAGTDGPAKPTYSVSYNQSQAFTYQGYITYHNTFGKHDLSGLIVLETRNTKSSIFGAGRVNYNVTVPELNNGSSNSTDISNYGYSAEAKQKSAVYRVTYGYNNKYLLEASGRYDGNYFFAPGNRFGFFPAFSAGWRVSEEDFIKNNLPWITNLKIRGSYGESGALAGSPFQYLNSYTLYGNASVLNGVTTQGLYENAEPNLNITWERAKKTDIGMEANLWNGLLTIEADYFTEKRTDMLFAPTITVPTEYGVGLSQVNSGAIKNHGIELTIGTSHRLSNDLNVSLNANVTYARNTLLQVYETKATYDNPNRRITGRPLGTQFGYQALGYFKAEDFASDGTLKPGIPTQPWGQVHPGDLRYADLTGPGGKPDGKIDDMDQKPIGHPAIPEILYGFSPRITFKGFDLTLLFQGATSRNFYLSGQAVWPFVNSASAVITTLDYWTPTHTDATNPRVTTQPTQNNTQTSSWWIRNGSYLRLKTGELGYTIPVSVMNRIKIQSIRFYVSGQNLLTWSAIKNFDPEVNVSTGQYYPQQRVVSLGLNVTF